MRRHAEGNYLVLLAKLLERERLVALVAVKYQQHVATHPLALDLLNKVPKPGQTKLVGSPAVITKRNNPIARYIVALVPGREVVLASEDDEGRDRPPSSADSLDHRSPLPIAWLYSLWPVASL